jgi:hypothetical protein
VAVLIRRLEEHDEVGHFDCGDDRLNHYLKRHAWQNQQKSSIGVTYVALDEAAPRSVVGYFTLATASVAREAFPKKFVRGLPPYELPLILLARLAGDRRFSKKGLGACPHLRSLQNRASRGGRCRMPLHYYGRLSRRHRVVCALRFYCAGGRGRRQSAANVSRYKNGPHGAQSLIVNVLIRRRAASGAPA